MLSPSEGCLILPAQSDLAARIAACVRLHLAGHFIKSFSCIPEKIVPQIKGSIYTEEAYRTFSFLKLQPWQQTGGDSYIVHTESACVSGQLVCVLAAVDPLWFFLQKKRNLALIVSRESEMKTLASAPSQLNGGSCYSTGETALRSF